MNYIHYVGYLSRASQAGKAQGRFSLSYFELINTVRVWLERDKERRALKVLSSQLLQDIGLSEEARWAEVSKPFWKA